MYVKKHIFPFPKRGGGKEKRFIEGEGRLYYSQVVKKGMKQAEYLKEQNVQ